LWEGAEDVVEQGGGGHFGAGAGALDLQRAVAVAGAPDGDAVVAAAADRQRVVGRQRLQADPRAGRVEARDVAKHPALAGAAGGAFAERAVEFAQGVVHLVRRRLQRRRQQRVHPHFL
jgi:hypothetical protein